MTDTNKRLVELKVDLKLARAALLSTVDELKRQVDIMRALGSEEEIRIALDIIFDNLTQKEQRLKRRAGETS